jgi:hypothetical protein
LLKPYLSPISYWEQGCAFFRAIARELKFGKNAFYKEVIQKHRTFGTQFLNNSSQRSAAQPLRFRLLSGGQSLSDTAGTDWFPLIHDRRRNPDLRSPRLGKLPYLVGSGIQIMPAAEIPPHGNQLYRLTQQQIDKIPPVYFTEFLGKVNKHGQLHAKSLKNTEFLFQRGYFIGKRLWIEDL